MATSRIWRWLRGQARNQLAKAAWPWGRRRRRLCVEQLEERVLLDGSQPFPVPLDPLKPFGSLVFARSQTDTIAVAGETDTYTLALDPGQVVSAILRPSGSSLQAGLRLRDPSSVTLASGDASSAGGAVVLQTAPVASAGTYSLDIVGLTGTGGYSVSLTLNALVEEEGVLAGASNDARATAQNLDGSSVALPGGGNRVAVTGQSDNGDDYYAFSLTAGQTATLALSAQTSGTVRLELQDAAGAQLAVGVRGADNADETISHFRAPTDGVYYARISAGAAIPYALVVTRGAEFDAEPNNTLATAGDANPTRVILGSFRGTTAVPPISTETEPNNDIAHANDLSGSFTSSGVNTFTASVQGTISPSGDRDFFKIYASPGDVLTLDQNPGASGTVITDTFEYLYNNAGVLLASDDDSGPGFYSHLVYTFGGTGSTYAGDYYAVAGGFSSNTGTYTFMAQLVTPQPIGIIDRQDFHAFSAAGGDSLTLTTTTPGDGTGQPPNDLDPLLELYDPAGVLVASNNNGAADGRNARITYTVPVGASGTYVARVAVVTGIGDYTLQISGATGPTARPLTVTASSLTDGSVVTAFPSTVRLTFSQPLLFSTVTPADLTINGLPASGVTVIDARTVEFAISGLNAGDTTYAVHLGASTVTDLQGNANSAFDVTFRVDSTAPVVTASSVSAGDVVPSGDLTYTAIFSEDLAASGLGAEDVTLVNVLSGQTAAVDSFAYDSANRRVTVSFRGLVDGDYALTLLSGASAFRDSVGNPLNGAPSFPLPSGQGNPAGDNFVVPFILDTTTTAFPTPLPPLAPPGALIHDSTRDSAFHVSGDSDSYTLNLDAGQALTVLLTPADPSIRAQLNITDPGGASVGTSGASVAGAAVLIQTAPVATTGIYRIDATSLAGTGRYTLEILLNAAREEEGPLGTPNNGLTSAQNLSLRGEW